MTCKFMDTNVSVAITQIFVYYFLNFNFPVRICDSGQCLTGTVPRLSKSAEWCQFSYIRHACACWNFRGVQVCTMPGSQVQTLDKQMLTANCSLMIWLEQTWLTHCQTHNRPCLWLTCTVFHYWHLESASLSTSGMKRKVSSPACCKTHRHTLGQKTVQQCWGKIRFAVSLPAKQDSVVTIKVWQWCRSKAKHLQCNV